MFCVRHDIADVHVSSANCLCQLGSVSGVSFAFKYEVERSLFLRSILWLATLAKFRLGLLDSVQIRVEWVVAAANLEDGACLASCHPAEELSESVEWEG